MIRSPGEKNGNLEKTIQGCEIKLIKNLNKLRNKIEYIERRQKTVEAQVKVLQLLQTSDHKNRNRPTTLKLERHTSTSSSRTAAAGAHSPLLHRTKRKLSPLLLRRDSPAPPPKMKQHTNEME
ncbi:unnamed protein product [Urochloa humidicola]